MELLHETQSDVLRSIPALSLETARLPRTQREPAQPRRAWSLTLDQSFALLSTSEEKSLTGRFAIRRREGAVVGLLTLQDGRVVSAAGLGGLSVAPGASQTLADVASQCQWLVSALESAVYELIPLGMQVSASTSYSAADVFLAMADASHDIPDDWASDVYERFVDTADAAILVVNEASGCRAPLPVRARGFDGVSCRDLLTLCQGVCALAQQRSFGQSAQGQTLINLALTPEEGVSDDKTPRWLGLMTAQRYLFLRMNNARSATQVFAALLAAQRAQPEAGGQS